MSDVIRYDPTNPPQYKGMDGEWCDMTYDDFCGEMYEIQRAQEQIDDHDARVAAGEPHAVCTDPDVPF